MSNVLSVIEALAVDKVSSKFDRDSVEPGEYSVDVTVRVSGVIKVGEDYEQRIVAKADPWLLLHVAMSHLNGVTMDSIVREALHGDRGELAKEVKEKADQLVQVLKDETYQICKGKVTQKLTVTKV